MTRKNSLITWLGEGCTWRWRHLRRQWFLLRHFRNGPSLLRSLRDHSPCDVAVCRDGSRLCHPAGRTGLVNTILEIWHDHAYTSDDFYSPADGDVVIDAGANVGLFSLWVARQNPCCRVLALEPFAENFACLQANLAAAKAEAVTACRMALGASAGRGIMQDVGARSLDHRLALADGNATGHETVPVIPLAGLFDLARTERINFLKLDIEGSEYEVFEKSSQQTLARIDRLAIEYHEHLRHGTLRLLTERLDATHSVDVRPDRSGLYGMIFARRQAN
jgi:FkbM family methyltransferase